MMFQQVRLVPVNVWNKNEKVNVRTSGFVFLRLVAILA